MRESFLRATAALSLVAALGCRQSAQLHGEGAPANNAGEPGTAPPPASRAPGSPAPAKPRGPVSETEALRPQPDLPPERRALVVIGAAPAQNGQPAKPGEERWVDADLAEAAGYTLVDFSDDWTPYIFAEQTGPDGQPLPNRYRRIFVGLAND